MTSTIPTELSPQALKHIHAHTHTHTHVTPRQQCYTKSCRKDAHFSSYLCIDVLIQQTPCTSCSAFAGDNVVEEDFLADKAALVDRETLKDEDITIPGWGSWGGEGTEVRAIVLTERTHCGYLVMWWTQTCMLYVMRPRIKFAVQFYL